MILRCKDKKIPYYDYLVVLLMPVLATFITVYFKISFLISIVLFLILPALYLTIRDPHFVKKILPISLALSVPFTIVVDYFAIRDGSWWDSTIFPIRFLNGIPIEDFIWFAAWFYFIIVFYEYFIDQPRGGKDTPINRRYKKMLGGWFVTLFVFSILYVFIEEYLFIPYFYFIFMMAIGMFPLILLLIKRPQFIYKYIKVMIYFFFVNFLHELGAFSAGHWYFPGEHFVGWVELLGGFRFPFEEFFLWMILGAAFVLTWYEYFIDDTK